MPYETKNYRQKMKAHPLANEERLRVQREKKQKYRQRVIESIPTATVANLVTEIKNLFDFLQAHIRSRSLQKVAKTLPKSPRKCQEVICRHWKTNSSCALSLPIESRKTKKRVD